MLAEQSADQASVSTGWASCVWPIFATPPRARPWYQAKKPRNIEMAADVGEAEPGVGADVRAPWRRQRRREDEERRGEHERPADHLPAAVAARERAAFRVPEGGGGDRGEHEQVGGREAVHALGDGEHEDGDEAGGGREPERAAGTLTGAQDGEHGGRGGQQADDHAGVGGGEVLERDRGEQREADHDAEGDEREARQVLRAGSAHAGSRATLPRAWRRRARGRGRRTSRRGPRRPAASSATRTRTPGRPGIPSHARAVALSVRRDSVTHIRHA